MLKTFYSLLFILFSFNILAQDLDLGDGKKLTKQQLDAFRAQLKLTTKDRNFFHWTSIPTAGRWLQQHKIDPGEIAFLNKPASNGLQAFGPGLYLAETHTSSEHFGEAAVTLTIKKGTPLYDSKTAMDVFGFAPDHTQESLISERLKLLRPAEGTQDWFVINSPEFTQDIRYAPTIEPKALIHSKNSSLDWSPFRVSERLDDFIKAGNQDAKYLKDILYASDYMDGVSFARAMKVNPGAPWNEFEPQNFEKYKQTLNYLSEDVSGGQGNLNSDMAKPIRATEMEAKVSSDLKGTALDLFNRVSGRNAQSIDEVYRTEGVRAGGDLAGQKFEVTPQQLAVLEANPYLEVEVLRQDGKILVNYYYPDAFHYKKLKSLISDDLFKRLEKASGSDLMNNHKLRNSLNKELIGELMTDLAQKLKNGESNLVDFIAIHPFPDSNGRTFRLLQKINTPQVTNIFLGDFDLLASKESQSGLMRRASDAHRQLQFDLYNEFLLARSQNRMPDYLKTKAISKYANNAFAAPLVINLDSPQTLQHIQQRNWPSLINEGIEEAIIDIANEHKNYSDKSVQKYKAFLTNEALENFSLKQKDQIINITLQSLGEKQIPPYHKYGLAQNIHNAVKDTPDLQKFNHSLDLAKPAIIKEILNEFKNGNPYSIIIHDIDGFNSMLSSFDYVNAIDFLEPDLFSRVVYLSKMHESFPDTAFTNMITSNLAGIAGNNGFAKLTPEQQKLFVEIYNNSVIYGFNFDHGSTEILKNYVNAHEKFLVDHARNIPGILNMEQLSEMTVAKSAKILATGELPAKAGAYSSYNIFYKNLSAASKKKYQAPEKIKAQLIKELLNIEKTSINVGHVMNAIPRLYETQFEQWKFMMENLDNFKGHEEMFLRNISFNVQNFLGDGTFVNGQFQAYTTAERAKIANLIPDIMGILTEHNMDADIKMLEFSYSDAWNTYPDELKALVLTPDEAKARAQRPAPNNMSWKDNCINNLLKMIF